MYVVQICLSFLCLGIPNKYQAKWTAYASKAYVLKLFHYSLFVCFDLGFHTRNPVIKYRPDASSMSYMEARAEMSGENNSQLPIPRAQRVADRVHLRLAFLLVWDSNPQRAD